MDSYAVWNLQQDTFVHCNYIENIINKISNGYLKYEISVICTLIVLMKERYLNCNFQLNLIKILFKNASNNFFLQ